MSGRKLSTRGRLCRLSQSPMCDVTGRHDNHGCGLPHVTIKVWCDIFLFAVWIVFNFSQCSLIFHFQLLWGCLCIVSENTAWLLRVLESPWIFFPDFQGLESPWKQTWSLKVLESVSESAWIRFSKTPWVRSALLLLEGFWGPEICLECVVGRALPRTPLGELTTLPRTS